MLVARRNSDSLAYIFMQKQKQQQNPAGERIRLPIDTVCVTVQSFLSKTNNRTFNTINKPLLKSSIVKTERDIKQYEINKMVATLKQL
eukprot:scaffold1816_cov165-Amphora_coffeaeformis.AAC.1